MPKLNNWMEDYYGYALEFGDVGDYLDLSPSSLLPDPDNFAMQVNERVISYRTKGELEFDGVDDYVDCGNDSSLNITSKLTLEAYIKSDGYTSWPRIVTKEGAYGLYFREQEHDHGLAFYGSGVDTYFPTKVNVNDGEWHHVAAVYDGSKITGYVDGVSVGTIAKSGDLSTVSIAFTIGNRPDKTRPFKGTIEDVRIWNTARTAQEIADNMNAKFTGTEPGLVAYWPLDEGTGTIAHDNAGNNHGTIHGANWVAVSHETATIEDGEVVVGGRNYTRNSDKFTERSNVSFPVTEDIINLLNNAEYVTASVYIEVENAQPSGNNRIGYELGLTYIDDTIGTITMWLNPVEGRNYKGRLSNSINMSTRKKVASLRHHGIFIQTRGDYLKVGQPKLEPGDTATPWTPSPEDITSLTQIDRTLPYFPGDGTLKTLRFYDRGLSDAEMMQNWNAGQGEDYVKDGLVFDGDFIGHGAILPDKTGHQNNATIHGPTWITIGRVPEKVIILNPKMRRVADLDPAKVIDPVTVEDLNTGEHTLSLGYPVDDSRDSGGRGGGGGGQNIRRLTGGGGGVEAWAGCEMDRTAIMTINGGEGQEQGQGQVVVCLDAEREAAEIEAEFNDQASWATGIFDDNCIAEDGKLKLAVQSVTPAGQQVFKSSGTFTVPAGVTAVQVLVVGGGGGGGGWEGGGGGAGGVVYNAAFAVTPGANIAVTIGAGGSGSPHHGNVSGQDSKFGTITAKGGGRGGGYDLITPQSGGSGGGGAGSLTTANRTGAAGTSGQGNKGANGLSAAPRAGGGGGGAGAAGGSPSSGVGGKGGNGAYYGDIFGTDIGASGYVGGGGGGWGYNTGGAGGTGGGGGGRGGAGTGTHGTANTGGGGGGGQDYVGGNGGSGLVVVKWAAVTVYKTPGTWIAPPLSLDAITDAAGSLVTRTATLPAGTSAKIYTGVNSSQTVQPGYNEQTPGQAISNIVLNTDYNGKYLWTKLVLSTTDPTKTPEVSFLSLSVTQDRAYYSTGAITLPPLDIAAARTIASATADLKATVISDPQSGQSVTLQMSVDGGVTWDDNYMLPYGTSVDDLPTQFILTRIKLETADPGTTPFVEQLLEEILVAAEIAHLTSGNILIIADPDGDLVPFVIYQDRTFAGTEETVKEVNCTHLYYELADGPVRNYNLTNAIPSTAIAAALNGTRWELGNVDDSLISLTKDFQAVYLNPLEMLRLIEHTYEARLKFRVTVGGAGITGYYVDLLEIDNEFRGQRFEFGHNLQGIDLRVDDSRIKTALVGIGIGDEIDLETDEPLPLTFKGVEWSVANGDPCDKPLGQDWVGDEHARLQYGIYDPVSGEKLHRFGKYESQAETPEGLLWATWQQLQKYHVKPQVNVEAQVADLEQVKIVGIKDAPGPEVEYSRDSVAYHPDTGEEIPEDTPVFVDFAAGKKGSLMVEGTENYFNSADLRPDRCSVEVIDRYNFRSAGDVEGVGNFSWSSGWLRLSGTQTYPTVILEEGYYTLSFTAELLQQGPYTPQICLNLRGSDFHDTGLQIFNLSSTPTRFSYSLYVPEEKAPSTFVLAMNSNYVEFTNVQIEKKAYDTPFQVGTRANPLKRITLPEPLPATFGIGIAAKMLHAHDAADRTFWECGGYRCYFDSSDNKLKMTNGVVTAETAAVTWGANDYVGVYVGRENGNLFIQAKIAGALTDRVEAEAGAGTGETLYVGSRADGSESVNAVVADMVFHDRPEDIDPEGYLSQVPGGGE